MDRLPLRNLQYSPYIELRVMLIDVSSPEGRRHDSLAFFKEALAFYNGVDWRGYDEYIGQKMFYDGLSDLLRHEVTNSSLVKSKIKELAGSRISKEETWTSESCQNQRRQDLESQLGKTVSRILDAMISTPDSKSFIKFAAFSVGSGLASMYHQGMHVVPEEVEVLKKYAQRAQDNKQSLILLPPHRSHVDYVSMQLCFYRLGLSLPMVVAGDNLDIPILGQFLRNCGAYYIRRQWADDVLYATVVQAYVDALLRNGYNMECFVEGSRSRTGKLMQPKLGMIRLIVSSIMRGETSDAWIVPTSVQYDRVIEAETYVSELLGMPKEKESIFRLVSSGGGLLQLKMGRIDVRFAEPWSLREFLQKQTSGRESFQLFKAVGYRVLGDINDVSVVMPTALVGTVILTLRGRGVGKAELVRRVKWLADNIKMKGGRVAEFGPMSQTEVVNRALYVLGGLVGEVKGLLEPTFYARDRFQLSFFRNSCIHHFVSEVIIAASLYTKIKQGGGPKNQQMEYDDLVKQTTFLSKVLKMEFIFSNTSGLVVNLKRTLEQLYDTKVLMSHNNKVELATTEREQGRENFDFYCFLIWPFIDTYWLAVASFFALAPDKPSETPDVAALDRPTIWVDKKAFESLAQLFGKTLYNQGDLSYLEAVNKETLGNAFQRFEEEGIILIRTTRSATSAPSMALHPDWLPQRNYQNAIMPSGKLWSLLEHIAVFRREGWADL